MPALAVSMGIGKKAQGQGRAPWSAPGSTGSAHDNWT
jgi:hypothetical protein